MSPFFRRKYLFNNHENNTYSSEKVVSKPYFSTVSDHFYSLAPKRNKCVYALSVPFLVLLLLSPIKNDGPGFHLLLTVWDIRASLISHTPWNIQDHGRCGFLGVSQSNMKPIDEPFLPSCWRVLKLRDRPFYPGLLQYMEPGSIILNRRQKRTRNGTDRAIVSRWCKAVQVDGDCRKIEFGDKPHLNVLLSWFFNTYLGEKTWGITFWETLVVPAKKSHLWPRTVSDTWNSVKAVKRCKYGSEICREKRKNKPGLKVAKIRCSQLMILIRTTKYGQK
jgi:hypothetical protein